MIKRRWIEKIFLVTIVVLIAGCDSSNTPEGAYENFNKAAMSGDWDDVASAISKNSLSRTEGQLKSMVARTEAYSREKDGRDGSKSKVSGGMVKFSAILDPADVSALKPIMNLSGKEFFIKAAKDTKKIKVTLQKGDYELIDVKIVEDKARLVVQHKGRWQEAVMLISEDGDWKVELNPSLFMRPNKVQQKKSSKKSKERFK